LIYFTFDLIHFMDGAAGFDYPAVSSFLMREKS